MKRWTKLCLMLILTGSFLLAGALVCAQAPPPGYQAPPPGQVPPPGYQAPPPPQGGKMGEMAPPASPEAAQKPPYSSPYPMGFVSIELKHVGVGVGMEWGDGLLTYKGKQYTFKVKGIQAGTVGISKVSARGEVYNLFQLAEFPGVYRAVQASAAVIKGKEVQDFKNTKGVHMVFKGTQKGLNLSIGPEGFTVKMEEALQP